MLAFLILVQLIGEQDDLRFRSPSAEVCAAMPSVLCCPATLPLNPGSTITSGFPRCEAGWSLVAVSGAPWCAKELHAPM